jgi:hypothetical protein
MLIDAPFSIIALMMMNHFAGIILLITCNGSGMLESGNMKPDRMITGSINPMGNHHRSLLRIRNS